MGHRDKNFHKDMMVRRGHREAADRIEELYLAGRRTRLPPRCPTNGSHHKFAWSARPPGSRSAIAPADLRPTGDYDRAEAAAKAVEIIAEAARAA